MGKGFRRVMELILSIGGTLLSVYVGGYLLLIRPVLKLYGLFMAGGLTTPLLFRYVIEVFLSMTVGGAIWCLFDILAGKFRDREE
ncbi:MAG: hypothetical protein J6N76_02980 [Lachnospiraceae bacterium]|nr:hypothetical protein [Lachnospiraceae bacterium]